MPAESYDDVQWRLLRHFANSEADAMDVEAMAWAVSEIQRLRDLLQAILNAKDIGTPMSLSKALNAAHLHLAGSAAK